MLVDLVAKQADLGKAFANHFARPVDGGIVDDDDLIRFARGVLVYGLQAARE
jgi:hypothetical protein